MTYPVDKKQLSKKFLEITLGRDTSDVEIKAALWSWWMNPISKTSMRLTEAGAKYLTETVNLTSYKYTLTKECERTPKVLLQLDKHLTTPFYLGPRRSIVFYGEKDAIMLAMMANNLNAYLDNLAK